MRCEWWAYELLVFTSSLGIHGIRAYENIECVWCPRYGSESGF